MAETCSHNYIVKKSYFWEVVAKTLLNGWRTDYIGDTIDNYWQIETLKSNQETVKVSLSVRTVGEILALFSVKTSSGDVQILLYILYILNIFVTGAWGSWRLGAEGEDYVFSDVKSFCFCSSNFETDLKHLFWKCLTFWSGFVANVEFMTFVLILIEVWIWGRDNVSFYANGQKDPKKQKHQ